MCTDKLVLDLRKNHTDKRADNNSGISYVKREEIPKLHIVIRGNSTGALIRQTRLAKNKSIEDVAREVGIHYLSLIRIENNQINPKITTLAKISMVLGVAITDLGLFDLLPENTLEEKIAKARLFNGMTNKQFANVLGVNQKTVRLWGQGKHKPSNKHLSMIVFMLHDPSNHGTS